MITLLLVLSLNVSEIKQDLLYSNHRDTVYLEHMTVKQFKNKLAELESGGRYTVVNQFGYKGKYQVSDWLIRRFAKNFTTTEDFLKSPRQQEVLMNRLTLFYISEIHRLKLDEYVGEEVGGITITLEGLLAGYHQHPKALVKFLKSNGQINLKDGNGVSVSRFVGYFEGI